MRGRRGWEKRNIISRLNNSTHKLRIKKKRLAKVTPMGGVQGDVGGGKESLDKIRGTYSLKSG